MRNMMIMGGILLILRGVAVADGSFYYMPDVEAPVIPYQRAFILYLDGVETLVLQSKYDVQESVEGKSLAWVVPVPAEPELASMDPESAYWMFWELDYNSKPNVTLLWRAFSIYFACFFFFSLVLYAFLLFLWMIPIFRKNPKYRKVRVIAMLLLFISFVLFLMYGLDGLVQSRGSDDYGVEVLKEERIGVYDAKVIKSDSSEAILAWLEEGEFHFEEKDVKVFDDYVKKGWCFVVANLAPNTGQKERSYEGLAAPLILRFPHEKPIYPLALTGTGGYDTKVVIYLATEKFVKADDDRLEMKYAGEFFRWHTFYSYLLSCEPEGFMKISDSLDLNLMKYKGTLTPEQMSTDLTFTLTDEDFSYQEHITVWSESFLE